MKCPTCKQMMEHRNPNKYQYFESGLNNVFLEGVDMFSCACGESIVRIPAVDELHRFIGLRILEKTSSLNGNELRFLRKNVGISAIKLSNLIGVDNATLSRWENGKQSISKPHDLLLRLIYCNMKRINPEEIVHMILDNFPEIQSKHIKIPSYVIPKMDWIGLQTSIL